MTVLFRLSSTNFPVRLLPKVVCVPSLAGGLQRTWYGIPKGALVAVGMGDLQCSVLATQPSTNDASKRIIAIPTPIKLMFHHYHTQF